MAVHILFGQNGSGKTRYLRKIVNQYTNDGYKVISNLNDSFKYIAIDSKKVLSMEEGDEPFGDYLDRVWLIRMRDKLLSLYAEMVLSDNDILVLDEIDSILGIQEVIHICSVLRDVKHLWKEIYLAGHSIRLLFDSDVNLKMFFKDGRIKDINYNDWHEYEDFM